VGALDSGELGLDFIDQTGTYSFPMYWDDTGESWVGMNVSRQPAGILFSATGDELVRWNGEPDLGEVLTAIGDAS
jgi:hypothetical protein